MKTYFVTSLRLTFIALVIFGAIYPLAITGIATLIGPNHGKGNMDLIGQSFTSARYFNGRPSAVNYNAAATGGSNKSTSNEEYLAQVQQRIDDFLKMNPTVKREDVTVDLVTASGGGLDPHISPKAALIQVDRVAKARRIPIAVVKQLVEEHVHNPLLGPSYVNVLKLNKALDQL